ncbi:MAG: hypothetical protein KJO54_02510 [Gammaproteobacteria bacterium]|nr:hypothetical protein [Gammaproteobacteria bacterium]NNF61968.1 hypothetical protein [Gammaproteobacteria bacterium]NNM21868.1 hypothetical protein [Gammaproteobacteria bacterium]
MTETSPARKCLRFGWAAVLVFACLGLLLESLHLVKLPLYMEAQIRRELWTLAHAHGTLLGLVNVVFGLYGSQLTATAAHRASAALRTAAVLMPAGFFLGGIGNPETDPSLAIVLVPIGALLLITAAAIAAFSAWQPADAATGPDKRDRKVLQK